MLPTQAVLHVTDYFKCWFLGSGFLLPTLCQQACDSVFGVCCAWTLRWVECYWLHLGSVLMFTMRSQKSYKQLILALTPAGCTSSIVNVRMNTAENPIRAVLRSNGVAPCHPFSPFLNVVPFALFLWVQTELFPLGPNVLSLIGDLPWQSALAHIKERDNHSKRSMLFSWGVLLFCPLQHCMMLCIEEASLSKWTY